MQNVMREVKKIEANQEICHNIKVCINVDYRKGRFINMSEIHSYDTQLLIDRRDKDLDEDEIADYITDHIEGNSLIAAGDEDLVKIHFHTNEPWKVLEYCNTIGEIYDIVVEDMIRQSAGLQG